MRVCSEERRTRESGQRFESLLDFYRLYPSKESTRAKSRKRGYFESLTQVVAAGMDPTCEEIETLDKDYKNGGIFIMSAFEGGRIKLSTRNLNCSTKDKFKHMLAYQMEFGYDLALSTLCLWILVLKPCLVL